MPLASNNITLFRRLLTQALIPPVLLLVVLAAGLIWQVRLLASAAQWVDHTDQVIASANHLLTVLEDVETGERTYLTIRNQQFLEQYGRANQETVPAFDRLRLLIADNPSQIDRLERVRINYGQWALNSGNKLSRFRRASKTLSSDYSISEDKEPMDVIRYQVAAFITEEEAIQNRRVSSANSHTANTLVIMVLGAILGGGLLGLSMMLQVRRATKAYMEALTLAEKNAALLTSTLLGIGDAVLVTDAAGRISRLNPIAEHLTGWTAAEALGKPARTVFPIFHETTREPVESPIDRVIKDKLIVALANHTVLVHRDGRDIPIDDSGAPIQDTNGNLIGVVLVFRDVTERRGVEQALEVVAERLRLALEAARMGWWQWNIKTNTLDWSDTLEAVHGMVLDSFDSTFEGFLKIVHPDDRQLLRDAIAHAIETKAEYSIEYRVPFPDGSIHWIAGEGQAYYDESGKPLQILGIGMDVTERRNIEEALHETQERFHRIADAMPQIVWTMRADGQIDYLNQRWRQYTGMPLEETQEKGLIPFIHPDDTSSATAAWLAAVQTGEPCEVEYRLRRHDGVYRWCLDRSLAVRGKSGSVLRWVGTGTDIDDQKRAEVALRKAGQEMARLHEREFNIASQLQGALQPPPAGDIPGFTVREFHKAAMEEASVGGDFFDVFPIDNGCTALVVGDLSGKGLAAAAQVAMLRNMLRYCLYTEGALSDAITGLNRVLSANQLVTGFATLFAGVYESSTQKLVYVNCGQEPALLYRAQSHEIEELSSTGPVLGSWEESQYSESITVLYPGDVLAVFTDGITEAGPNRRDMLGIEGMSALLLRYAGTTSHLPSAERAEDLLISLIYSVDEFAMAGVRDDVSLLIGIVDSHAAVK